jgi:acyl carrier protein
VNAEQARAAVIDALAEIAPEADLATVSPQEDLRELLDLDSMDFLSLVADLSERIGTDITEDEYAELDTLGQAVDLLVRKSG